MVMVRAVIIRVGLIWLCLVLVSCSQVDSKQQAQQASRTFSPERFAAFKEWMDGSPCGRLRIEKPFFNVSGVVHAGVRPGYHAFLYTAHNTSQDGALYVVGHCRYITRERIDENGSFTINSLPAGAYVLAVPMSVFQSAQGFLVLDEFSRSGYVLETHFQGSNNGLALVSFTIRPVS